MSGTNSERTDYASARRSSSGGHGNAEFARDRPAPLDLAAIERWTDRQRAVIAEYGAHPDHICRHRPRCAVVTNGARP